VKFALAQKSRRLYTEPMKTRAAVAAALCALLFLTGCIDTTTKITVKPDGSGTIEKTLILSRHLAELMISMGTKGDAATIEQGMLNEKSLRDGAARMGSGVSFVSAKKITADKGNGWNAVYSFTDISKLRINQNPAADLTLPGTTAAAAAAAASADSDNFRFTFVKGSSATLTVAFPKPDQSAKPAGGPPAGAGNNQKLMDQMKQLYSDLRIVLTIEVGGTITQTNAAYVSGSTVTLLDMDFAKIIGDDATFKKLTTSQNQSMPQLRATVKSVPGVKIETQDPVSITFK
jgi:hypothetical protein